MGDTFPSGIESLGVAIIAGILSAIAASWGYGVYQRRAHRRVLLQELREQIERFAYTPAMLNEGSVFHRHTIHVHAVSQLLTGHVLDDVKDRELIRWLSIWQSVESQHNDAVRLAHRAVISPETGSFHRQQIFAMIDEHHGHLREVRERIRRLLFEPLVHGRPPRELEDDYLDWGVPRGRIAPLLAQQHRWDAWLLKRRSPDVWKTRVLGAIEDVDASQAASRERFSKEVEAENHNRLEVLNRFNKEIIPAIQQLKEPLLRHQRSLDVQLMPEKSFDPINPGRHGLGIASYTSIGISIRNMFDTSNAWLVVTARSTPTGVTVWLVHYQPPSWISGRGWKRQICSRLSEFTPDVVVSAVLQRYEHILTLPRDKYDR